MDMRASAGGGFVHGLAREILASSSVVPRPAKVKRIGRELQSLAAGALPETPAAAIFVRADESRSDVLKALISGPTGSPYALGLYEFDIFLPDSYPETPPLVKFKTTGNGLVRLNPNLYCDGKVCLSILGTWHGEPWNPRSSTLLQVLVSIQSLILVPQPYFNEPGYQIHQGSEEGLRRSRQYDDAIHLHNIRLAMTAHLREPPLGFGDVVAAHFSQLAGPVLDMCAAWGREATSQEMRNEIAAAAAALRDAMDKTHSI